MGVLEIRAMVDGDPVVISEAFTALGWPGRTVARYEGLLGQQLRGERDVFVATVDGELAGYVTLTWEPTYDHGAGIPEVQDLNVLPVFRRRGIGNALMDAAEARAAERASVIGIGVGLYADYGSAQRMYVQRGYLPDGRGVMYDWKPVPPGETIRLDDDATLMFTKLLG
ncbi:GNAT family N-acetyltransferase [Kribbella sp. NPDC056861]|uniref:GNAT family N-acetyltransferase n=1 Tax=Kribbella sp. NPDC056861 TaxID=3154857 RepID=UPI0034209489